MPQIYFLIAIFSFYLQVWVAPLNALKNRLYVSYGVRCWDAVESVYIQTSFQGLFGVVLIWHPFTGYGLLGLFVYVPCICILITAWMAAPSKLQMDTDISFHMCVLHLCRAMWFRFMFMSTLYNPCLHIYITRMWWVYLLMITFILKFISCMIRLIQKLPEIQSCYLLLLLY